MKKLSVVLIVRNEEENIKDCLGTVNWAGEIVLVDQSSSDKTVEIARKHTNRIFIVEPKDICNPDRMFGIEKARNDWILLLEADERVTQQLREEMADILKKEGAGKVAYYLPVKSYFCGRWIRYCGWYPAYNLRLFKRGQVYFSPDLHSDKKTLVRGPSGYLTNPLLHYSYPTISHYLPKLNRYTTQWAKEEYEKGFRISIKNWIVCFFIKPLYFFLKKYFFLKGYREGFSGLFISLSSGLVIFMNYAKLWELQVKDETSH